MQVEREKALEHKKRMSRMMEDKESFLSTITAARSFIYEVRSSAWSEPAGGWFSCISFSRPRKPVLTRLIKSVGKPKLLSLRFYEHSSWALKFKSR